MNLEDYITPHFQLREFLWSQHCHRHAAFHGHPRVREAQEAAIEHLARQLEAVRSWYNAPGEKVRPIHILSGMRDGPIQQQLVADGIRSSSMTDHAYFNPDVWAWGVGAVDFRVHDMAPERVMADLFHQQHQLAFSYAILYEWGLHLSAPFTLVLGVRPKRERFRRQVAPGEYQQYGLKDGDGHGG